MVEEEDIRDVRREEESRGRRPVDIKARRQTARLRADLHKALKAGDERAFLKILREAGLKDGTPEFVEALKLFRKEVG